jgi:hypothetical protein
MSKDYYSFWRGSRDGRAPIRRPRVDKAADAAYKRSLAEKGDLVYVQLPQLVTIRAEVVSGPDEVGQFELRVFQEDQAKAGVAKFKSTRTGLIVFSKGSRSRTRRTG